MKLKKISKFNKCNINKNYKKEYINYLDTANITEGIINEIVEYKVNEAPSRAKRIVHKNDIIYSTVRPNLKHYGIMTDLEENLIVSTGFTVITCNNNINSNYVYAYLTLPYITNKLASIAEGSVSTYPSIRPQDLGNVEIKLPDEMVQTKIANIYTTYNNLIINNNKSIVSLEQIVEEIYKEWFVRYRFPEYKNYNFVNAKPYGWIYGNKSNMKIPSNWHFGKLDEIGQFIRGKNITSSEMQEGEIPVVSAGKEPSGFHNDSNVKGISLTMSASGANAGYLKYNLEDIWAADCSYYQNDENIWFVYSSLKFIESAIKNIQIGSAQPHVYAKNINKLNIIIPEEKYIKKYNDLVSPMFKEIKKINEKNKLLIKQRDLLLPRLMSGKLEVK